MSPPPGESRDTGARHERFRIFLRATRRRLGDDGHLLQGDDPDTSPARLAVDRMGDTWSLYTLGTLEAGSLRFSEIEQRIPGISQRMLTLTLRSLERDGYVTRQVYAEVPPRVEYTLTDLGESFLMLSLEPIRWAYENQAAIQANRDRFDAERDRIDGAAP